MTMSQQTTETGGVMAAKATPPLAVVGAHLAGLSISDWVQYATLIYVLMLIGQKGWHIWKELKTGKDPENGA